MDLPLENDHVAMNLFLLNLGLALLWAFLGGQPSFASVLVGFALGFALLAGLQRLYPRSGYVRRMFALARFLGLLAKDLAISNLTVAHAVLARPRQTLKPGLLTYDLSDLTPGEALVLTHLVTLTPGTTAVEVAENPRRIQLHVFDAADPEAVRRSLDRQLKQPLLAVLR